MRHGLEAAIARFLSRTAHDPFSECILYTGALDKYGYGNVRVPVALVEEVGAKVTKAHRLVYFLVRGPLVPGSHVDHLCNVRNCVNPYHLEQVTARTNCQRANITKHYGVSSAEQHEVSWGPDDEDPWQ